MRAVEAQIALATPDQPNNLDRLLKGCKRVARLTSRPAVRLNRVPEAAGTQGKLEPPTAEYVEARGGLSQHRWRAQRKIRHVGEEADPGSCGRNRAHQGQCQRIAAGMDHIECRSDQGRAAHVAGSVKQWIGSVGDKEVSERQVTAVVGHPDTLSRGPGGGSHRAGLQTVSR